MALPVSEQFKYWGIAAAIFFVLLYALGDQLLPFFLGAAIAYFLDPVADWLEAKGCSRALATALITISAVIVFVILALLVIPTLVEQSVQLFNAAPEIARNIGTFLSERFPSLLDEGSTIRQSLNGLGQTISERGGHEGCDFFVYGRKGAQYAKKRGFNVKRCITDPPMEEIDYRNAALTGRMLVEEFESGAYRDVHLAFTSFESMVKYRPDVLPFLPLTPDAFGDAGEGTGAADVSLEPDAESIFERLVPRYLETRIYNGLLEALTSEYASRRFAMKNATDAASDMQKELKAVYNRKRQEGITKELLDIVGGSEAVK